MIREDTLGWSRPANLILEPSLTCEYGEAGAPLWGEADASARLSG